jgi:hypothetical protein
MRWRALTFAGLWLILGGLAIWQLSTYGRATGFALIAIGLVYCWRLFRAIRNAPGTIRVDAVQAHLPAGHSSGVTESMPLGDVDHVYLLRREVPWGISGPVLVIETRRGVFSYPRDWFLDDKDQRAVADALMRGRSPA